MQDKLITKKTSLNFKGKLEDINGPKILGILNLTPDSFYDGGKNNNLKTITENVKKMLEDGADFIDVGAYSSRPGAKHISTQEEIDRLLPTIVHLLKTIPNIKISVDTFRSEVADLAVEAGALMINDISCGNIDSTIWDIAAKNNVPYIAMHMQGTPETMQERPIYTDVIEDIVLSFSSKIEQMKQHGVKDIIIDPGFGFGKTLTHNYEILKHLKSFELLGHPILIGVSRKSMIYKLLESSPEEALNGTSVLNTLALDRGADFLRVHDVKQAKETIILWQAMNNPQSIRKH